LGRVLATIALLLQLALPGLHPPGPLGSKVGSGDFPVAFDEHALCLAPGAGNTETPANQSPKPFHHEFSACCFWHGSTGLALTPTAAFRPIAFARSAIVFRQPTAVAPRRLAAAVSARGPPVRA
jgi:hypothetical protein